MTRLGKTAALLLVSATLGACASGQRPMKQLETNDFMIGGNLNGFGPRTDFEAALWFRYAPWTYIDVTAGGVASIPFFEAPAGGFMVELRGHIPITQKFRLVLTGTEELINRKYETGGREWTSRVSGMLTAVYEAKNFAPYIGPKVIFMEDFDRRSDFLTADWDFRNNGSGMYILGGNFGFETSFESVSVIGAALEGGLLLNARSGVSEGVTAAASVYIGF